MKPPGIAGAPTGAYTGFGIGPDAASWNADSQVTYGYDTAGRFNAVSGTALPPGGVAYSYLPASDLIERLEYKDAAGAVLAATVRSFEPGRGLLTSVENQWMGSIGVPPVTVSMYADQSDSLGRRSSVVRTGSAFATGAGASGDVKLTFAYDYRDRRVRKLVETWSGTAWQTADDLRFVYDDWNLVMELDGRSGNASLRKFSRVRCADHSVRSLVGWALPTKQLGMRRTG